MEEDGPVASAHTITMPGLKSVINASTLGLSAAVKISLIKSLKMNRNRFDYGSMPRSWKIKALPLKVAF